jgi:hypothetical protein
LLGAEGVELDDKDFTDGVNNMLHFLFDQCNISLNGTLKTHSSNNYNSRASLETLLTYGSDAAESHLTNAYCYKDDGDILTCDPTDTSAATAHKGWARRWLLQKQSKEIEMVGRLYADICNAQTFIVPGVTVNVRLTKVRREFYLMAKDEDSKVTFKSWKLDC